VTDLNNALPDIPSGWQLISARGITDSDRIAGEALDNSGTRVLYVYDPTDTNPFQPVGVGVGNSIRYRDMNDVGDLLFAEFGSSNSYLYKHDDQQTVALPTALMQSGQCCSAGPAAVNNDRVIAGNRNGLSQDSPYIYSYTTGLTTNIPKYFHSQEINNDGTVVGKGTLSNKGNPTLTATAMKYDGGVKSQLVSSRNSEAFDINDAGQVVGRIDPASGNSIPTAFLYDPSQGFWSLNDLIQDTNQDEAYWRNGDSGVSVSVQAMSERLSSGYPVIVGDRTVSGSMFSDGIDRHLGFILTPIGGGMASALQAGAIPEPATVALVALALLSLATRRGQR
jgi:probable HAF family extracellular repeat protein